MDDQAAPDTGSRVAAIAVRADLEPVAAALRTHRDEILERWLAAASRQPFHAEHPDAAVADHIPALFDALVDLLGRDVPGDAEHIAPMDDPLVAREAEAHAEVRFEQGLGPIAVVTEFRLLRQEIARALATMASGDARPVDVVGSLAIINDGLDGAATIGLSALSDRIETLREAFLATTLHDVRQPITLVEGSLVLADRWLGDPEADAGRVREAVGDALSATGELTAMIDTLSDATRVALGALEPDPEPASLETVARDAVAALGATARQRVRIEVAEGPHLIGLWDAGLLRRLVANLVGNGLKYSPDGGDVTVEVGPGDGEWARLRISDVGLGMTADELEAAFGRYVRADRARRHGIPGLGLGLYACRGIVEVHGGTIEIASDGIGRGTVVTIELPLLDPSSVDD